MQQDPVSTEAADTPPGLHPRRRLGIGFVDVVGFSAMMHADEDGTFHRWTGLRSEVVTPLIAEYGGRLVKQLGDGILASFGDPVTAARWACALQRAARQRRQGLSLRVALHYADVLADGDDLIGDGINLTARLQEYGPPGGVIVTDEVRAAIAGHDDMPTRALGRLPLRKMGNSVMAWEILTDGRPARDARAVQGEHLPSIAVMPFRSLSEDGADAYFAAGLAEDIVTSLSALRELRVVSRASTLSFAHHPVAPREIGQALGVRYLITGAFRRDGHRLRVTTELLDTDTGEQVFSERRDFSEPDTFRVQDEIVETTLRRLVPSLQSAERRKALRKWPASFSAYDHYLRGLDLIGSLERRDFDAARAHLHSAIEADPGFSAPVAWTARWYSLRVGQGWSTDRRADSAEAAQLAMQAIRLDRQNALALATYGHIQSYLFGDFETAIGFLDRARDRDPNSAIAWSLSSVTLASLGRTYEAIAAAERALRLSPFDPRLFAYFAFLGIAHYDAGNYDEAIVWLSRSLAENGRYTSALRTLAVALVAAGRQAEARETVARLIACEPDVRVGVHARSLRLYLDEARSRSFRDRLLQAGAPE